MLAEVPDNGNEFSAKETKCATSINTQAKTFLEAKTARRQRSVPSDSTTKSVPSAVRASLPKDGSDVVKSWRRATFTLARNVVSFNLSKEQLKEVFQMWHVMALSKLPEEIRLSLWRIRQETWNDFKRCLGRVKYPAGYFLERAFNQSQGSGKDRLLSLCKVLAQANPDEPFHIAERAAAPLFGVNRATIGRWLKQLEKDGKIKLVVNHSYGQRRAKGWLVSELTK